MRLAFFSPLPPQRTGIADYSAALLAQLRTRADVVLFADQPQAVQWAGLDVRATASFRGLHAEQVDLCLYQMGNNVRYHRDIHATALRYPGLTVLHDLNLYAFHDDLLVRQGRTGSYLREMSFAYGAKGTAAALALTADPRLRRDEAFPLLERIAGSSLGVLVHSRYARGYVRRHSPRSWVRHVNQPVPLPPHVDRDAARRALGYMPDEIVLAAFGYAAWTKRIHKVLPVLAELRQTYPHLRLAVVGAVVDGYEIQAQAADLGLSDIVRFTGFVDPSTYAQWQAATDIGINLRYPTTGETSAALLGLLATGTPALVSNVDAFVELPDDACIKIDPDDGEADQLARALRRLLDEPDVRTAAGHAARRYVAESCDPAGVAAAYLDFAAAIIQRAGRL